MDRGGRRPAGAGPRLPQPRRPRVRPRPARPRLAGRRAARPRRRSTTRSCASSCGAPSGRWCASARHSSLAFLELVRAHLPGERDDQILLAAPGRGARGAGPLRARGAAGGRGARLRGDGARDDRQALPEGDLRTLWLRAAIGAVAAPADVAALAAVVDQEPGTPRVQVDREMRWGVAALGGRPRPARSGGARRGRARRGPDGPRRARDAARRDRGPRRGRQGRGLGADPRRRATGPST